MKRYRNFMLQLYLETSAASESSRYASVRPVPGTTKQLIPPATEHGLVWAHSACSGIMIFSTTFYAGPNLHRYEAVDSWTDPYRVSSVFNLMWQRRHRSASRQPPTLHNGLYSGYHNHKKKMRFVVYEQTRAKYTTLASRCEWGVRTFLQRRPWIRRVRRLAACHTQ